MCFDRRKMFKATAVITSSTDNTLVSGQPVPFRLQYRKNEMAPPTEVFEVTDPNLPVYYRKYICEWMRDMRGYM